MLTAAVQTCQLEEETGVRPAEDGLPLVSELVVDHREGRHIVCVEPGVARGLDLTGAASDIVPAFLDSALCATMAA